MEEGKSEKYGWCVRMDHKFPERWTQNFRPRLNQIWDIVPMIIRYIIWWVYILLFRGVRPFIDPFMLTGKQIYGVPLGGIGSGTIGRGFKGEFCRFQMTPGLYTYDICHADQFILSVRDPSGSLLYQKVLNGSGDPGTLSSWDWSFNPSQGQYRGLYPRSWYTFNIPEQNLVVECKQVSPVIPHNYKDSCMPMASFQWTVQNNGDESRQISITFTFRDGTGSTWWSFQRGGKCESRTFSDLNEIAERIKGVELKHKIRGLDVTYGIGCLEKPNQKVTAMTDFDLKTGADLWHKLYQTGELNHEFNDKKTIKNHIGMALSCSCIVEPQRTEEMIFSLVWHQPQIHFRGKMKEHIRRYTRFFSSQTTSKFVCQKGIEKKRDIINLTEYCLTNYLNWDKAITQWQHPILSDGDLPNWFKSAIFNELYFISDGGSVWLEYDPSSLPRFSPKEDVRNQVGRFAYLEGHEYRMYNTYDVHFYASFALVMLWPELQKSVQYDMADAIHVSHKTQRVHLFDGHRSQRKRIGTVPHDLGDPSEDPFLKVNSYPLHDVAEWRDLSFKFILQVFRDFKFTKDKNYLNEMIPICTKLIENAFKWDSDGDGLIENSGTADQTYDAWIMTGASAYCGGLWMASLKAMIDMVQMSSMEPQKKKSDMQFYSETLKRATKAYHDKLWTGKYYKFDSSSGKHGNVIMSDQLCGHWFLSMCQVDTSDILPQSNVTKVLDALFHKNVQSHSHGNMGAVNGMNPDGSIDLYAIQSEEIWTGVTYALAANMIYHGMIQEGFRTAEGIYRTVYERIGLGFETPEALYSNGKYRAIGYMRSLSIWSIIHAWHIRQKPT